MNAPLEESVHTESAQLVRRCGPHRFRKVLITGLGRSGTSAVASVLRQCGFFLGPDCDPVLHESPALQELLLRREGHEIAAALDAWAAEHPRIAWKDPKLFTLGGELIDTLPPDWLVVAVFRDPVAIAARRVLADGVEFVASLAHCAEFQRRLASFTATTTKSVLFVSYERLMAAPIAAIADISEHLDLGEAVLPPLDDILATMLRQREVYRRRYAQQAPNQSGGPQ